MSTPSEEESDARTTHSAAASRSDINRRILAIALPTFGQLIAEPTFILIDTAIVGHIGDAALAGLSIGSTIILTTVGLCVFLAYGTTSQVARLIGAGQRKRGLEAGIDGMWLALIIGVVVAALIFWFCEPLCSALGAQGDVLTQARRYVNATVFGLPGMLLVYAANGIFRGLNKVRITLVTAIAGAVINTLLDMLFVWGFGWGIAGSGTATLIAQWSMGIMLTWAAALWSRAEGASWKPRLGGILTTAGDGLPLFVRTLALRACMVGTVMLAARMGEQVLAAYQAVSSVWNFVINMLDAIGIGGQALVATALGASKRDEARLLTSITARMGAVMGAGIGVALIVMGFVGAPLFSPTVQVQHLITVGMIVLGVFLPLGGWMWALDGILIGAGDYRFLATTCCLVAAVYAGAIAIMLAVNATLPLNDTVRMIELWTLINVVFIGGRGLANGMRARTDAWMR